MNLRKAAEMTTYVEATWNKCQQEAWQEHSPKREWAGLTDEEIQEMTYNMRQRNMGVIKTEEIFREVEAKLKEKNT